MSFSMRSADWERLFADHPDAGYYDNDLSRYWTYDPLHVAQARVAAIIRRDIIRPIGRALDRMTTV